MKVIFLDIDGPMIPMTSYLNDIQCSIRRRFPEHTIAVLNEICKRTDAQIVINSVHNNSFGDDVPDIVTALINAGVDKHFFHEKPNTQTPSIQRKLAVEKWLSENQVDDWMAIDDYDFLAEYEGHEHPQMVWVDPDPGLCVRHINQVIERFGGKPTLMLM